MATILVWWHFKGITY